jgi:hypothetical protein
LGGKGAAALYAALMRSLPQHHADLVEHEVRPSASPCRSSTDVAQPPLCQAVGYRCAVSLAVNPSFGSSSAGSSRASSPHRPRGHGFTHAADTYFKNQSCCCLGSAFEVAAFQTLVVQGERLRCGGEHRARAHVSHGVRAGVVRELQAARAEKARPLPGARTLREGATRPLTFFAAGGV